jgi:hypothetical protein
MAFIISTKVVLTTISMFPAIRPDEGLETSNLIVSFK